jgi:hypothetical protein
MSDEVEEPLDLDHTLAALKSYADPSQKPEWLQKLIKKLEQRHREEVDLEMSRLSRVPCVLRYIEIMRGGQAAINRWKAEEILKWLAAKSGKKTAGSGMPAPAQPQKSKAI